MPTTRQPVSENPEKPLHRKVWVTPAVILSDVQNLTKGSCSISVSFEHAMDLESAKS